MKNKTNVAIPPTTTTALQLENEVRGLPCLKRREMLDSMFNQMLEIDYGN